MVLLKAVINFRKPSSVGKKNLQRTTIMIMISFIFALKGGPFKNRTRTKEGDQLNAVYEVQRSPSIRNISSKISGFDHEKNPQVGCSCSFCENHWGKTHSPRYLKVPR